MKKKPSIKKKILMSCVIGFVVLVALVVCLKWDAIFQRGNPIPYLTAAVKISEKNAYVAVDEAKGIYISKNGECPELFNYFESVTGSEYVEQAGSGYIFTDGTETYVISSEVYWGKYKVWTFPLDKDRLIYGDTHDPKGDHSEYAITGEGECLGLSDTKPTE